MHEPVCRPPKTYRQRLHPGRFWRRHAIVVGGGAAARARAAGIGLGGADHGLGGGPPLRGVAVQRAGRGQRGASEIIFFSI